MISTGTLMTASGSATVLPSPQILQGGLDCALIFAANVMAKSKADTFMVARGFIILASISVSDYYVEDDLDADCESKL